MIRKILFTFSAFSDFVRPSFEASKIENKMLEGCALPYNNFIKNTYMILNTLLK